MHLQFLVPGFYQNFVAFVVHEYCLVISACKCMLVWLVALSVGRWDFPWLLVIRGWSENLISKLGLEKCEKSTYLPVNLLLPSIFYSRLHTVHVVSMQILKWKNVRLVRKEFQKHWVTYEWYWYMYPVCVPDWLIYIFCRLKYLAASRQDFIYPQG